MVRDQNESVIDPKDSVNTEKTFDKFIQQFQGQTDKLNKLKVPSTTRFSEYKIQQFDKFSNEFNRIGQLGTVAADRLSGMSLPTSSSATQQSDKKEDEPLSIKSKIYKTNDTASKVLKWADYGTEVINGTKEVVDIFEMGYGGWSPTSVWNNDNVKKIFNYSGKVGKFLPFVGYASDITSIATAKGGKERSEEIGKAIGSSVGSVALASALGGLGTMIFPGVGTAIGYTAGSIAGDYLGGKLGGIIGEQVPGVMDQIQGFAEENYNYAKKIYSENIGSIDIKEISSEAVDKFNMVTDRVGNELNYAADRVKNYFWGSGKNDKPKETNENVFQTNGTVREPIRVPASLERLTPHDIAMMTMLPTTNNPLRPLQMSPFPARTSSPSPAPVNVSLPPGAIQLSLPGNELNYEELSAVLGEKLTAAIKQSLMNSNVAFNAGR